ncbi:MAG: sodium ion-translocating decarboxylase subunit beta [Clostridiales bacterium]|jgi:hypothetical protein|nr:sodium ion-translocating decarboxylase subunit beta [Clostridiales bacterium]
MGVWNQFERLLVGAVDNAVEFHRRKSLNQRLKEIVKKENAEINRTYLALGKYYYENLRQKVDDEAAERMCGQAERSQERMRKARKRLVDLRSSGSVAVIGGEDGPTAIYVAKKVPLSNTVVKMELEIQKQNTESDQEPAAGCDRQLDAAQADQPQNREAADENEEWIPPLPDSVEE